MTAPRPNDIFRNLWSEGMDSIGGCKKAALDLFIEIEKHHGEKTARAIFAMWGTPPTKARIATIKNWGLLSRLDIMSEPNVQQLAREVAEENKKLPRSQRRGAGSTSVIALEKHIRRQIDERKEKLANRTWCGPVRVKVRF